MPEDQPQIQVENDNNFIGFSSRLDPSNLAPSYSQSSKNMRLQRGTAQPRKGCQRLTTDEYNGFMQSGSGYYIDKNGQDNIVLLFSDGMVLYNTQTETFSQKYNFPQGRYLTVGEISSQVASYTTISPGVFVGQISLQSTIGLNIGDKIKVGYGTTSPAFDYQEYTVSAVNGTSISYNYESASPRSGPVSLAISQFSFSPEIVQALNNIYIFRGVAGSLIGATITNPSITNGQTVSVTVTTINPHGLRVGSEVNIIDTITPYAHKYFHKNVIVASVISATQFTFSFTNTTGSTIQSHTNISGFNIQQANPPLVWDGVSNSLTYVDQTGLNPDNVTYPLPPGEFGLYFQNRIVVKTNSTEIIVTDILSDSYDPLLNSFIINQGGNDSIIGVLPWIENQFLVFMAKSIYVAYIDPRFDETVPDQSQVTVVTTEVGCLARHSIVPAGQFVFFFSGKGVHMLTPQLDLKLLGNTVPLSEPIDDYFDSVNFDYAKKVTAIYFDNRFFIAFPVNGGIKNNSILVYNTLNKAWESIDTYPSGMYIDNFIPAFYNNKRRLFIIANIGKPIQAPLVGPFQPGQPTTFLAGAYGGIFLAEELEAGDQFLGTTGSPLLPFSLPQTLRSISYLISPIKASIRSREYTFDSQLTKRFSRAEFQFNNSAGDDVSIYTTVHDPDASEEVIRYVFSGSSQIDGTLRPRIAMKGVAIDVEVQFNFGRPALKSASIYAINSNRGMITEE